MMMRSSSCMFDWKQMRFAISRFALFSEQKILSICREKKILLTVSLFFRTTGLQDCAVCQWNHSLSRSTVSKSPPTRRNTMETSPLLITYFFSALSRNANKSILVASLRAGWLVVDSLLAGEEEWKSQATKALQKLRHHDLLRWLMCRFTLTFLSRAPFLRWNVSPFVRWKVLRKEGKLIENISSPWLMSEVIKNVSIKRVSQLSR